MIQKNNKDDVLLHPWQVGSLVKTKKRLLIISSHDNRTRLLNPAGYLLYLGIEQITLNNGEGFQLYFLWGKIKIITNFYSDRSLSNYFELYSNPS